MKALVLTKLESIFIVDCGVWYLLLKSISMIDIV